MGVAIQSISYNILAIHKSAGLSSLVDRAGTRLSCAQLEGHSCACAELRAHVDHVTTYGEFLCQYLC